MTDKSALKELARQEKRFAAANCGSSYANGYGGQDAGGGEIGLGRRFRSTEVV